ncbi:RNA-dependent RNA polymerase [Bipolaris maydis victorivirus 1b]|nr:RNA-dependent RNA polymerase [Bipolaris maydis victorivirus 1b]
MSDPQERSKAYGLLGERLLSVALANSHLIAGYDSLDFTARLVRLTGEATALKAVDPLLPCALSLLFMDFPLQLPCTPEETLRLVRRAYDPESLTEVNYASLTGYSGQFARVKGQRGRWRHLGHLVCNDKVFRERFFPKKRHAAAAIKTNIRLGPLARAWSARYGLAALGSHLAYMVGMPNDRACATLLLAQTYKARFGSEGVTWAIASVLQPANAKGLSNALKALGSNTSEPGALFVEANTLQGRYDRTLDMDHEVESRCSPSQVREQVIPYSDELGACIDFILDLELGSDIVELPDEDEWWTSRWLWCVNGSQNALSDKALGIKNKSGQRYRRMAAEEVNNNPVPSWNGHTSVSPSVKLENGKDRAIFACDTRSYFAFTYWLAPIEKRWRGSRVILNPGEGGLYGTARRIRGSQTSGGVNLMLDYDNFNSQHSNETMAALYAKALSRTNAPAYLKNAVAASVESTYIHYKGRDRHVLGTLMSGHRATTFTNSVMNAAYICYAVGIPAFKRMVSLHAGDDVYLRLPTLADCATTLKHTTRVGCRMNPTKQSIGYTGAEFLRLGINKSYAIGYLCRAIASLVSGSWTSLDELQPLNALNGAIVQTRSCLNRGAATGLPELISASFVGLRGFKRRDLLELLTGVATIKPGPVYTSSCVIREYIVEQPPPPQFDVPPGAGMHATMSYLARHTTLVEAQALEIARPAIKSLMLSSSYGKAGPGAQTRPHVPMPKLRRQPPRVAVGFSMAHELTGRGVKEGCLSGHPLLRLFEQRLSDDDLRALVALVGGNTSAKDIRAEAFGAESSSSTIMGILPHSDASNYCKRTRNGNIIVPYHIRS